MDANVVNVYPDYTRIQRLRTARGLTQAELAEQLEIPASAFSRVSADSCQSTALTRSGSRMHSNAAPNC